MKEIQVYAPEENGEEVREVLDSYSSDVYSVQGERNGSDIIEFTATVVSSDIDDAVSELKSIKQIESGELVVRVLKEESLIEKGQKTRGGSAMLSQEEIYSSAQESANFNYPQWALIALSAAIASYGLILDNVTVVIGAMMLAPMLSPIVSSAVSLTIGDKTLLKQAAGTSFLSILIALTVSTVSVIPFPSEITPLMSMIVSSEIPNMLLSLFVGSAAVLAFVTGMRDQIAGVAVAIALVPPLAAAGVGLRMAEWLFASRAFSIAVVNLLAVIVSGSTVLKLLGFKPSTYYKKKSAENLHLIYPVSMILMSVLMALLLLTSF